MSGEPLVSVIMIFLNAEEFIQEAIESVLAQSYLNWELLLVDDGSRDSSSQVALRYAEQDPGKVRYLQHDGLQNRGMSASRNLGTRNAKGEYIAFFDADDIWLRQKLEQQVTILESQPDAAMVYGPARWWYSWTGSPEDMQRDYIQDLGVRPNTLIKPPKLLTMFLRNAGFTPSPSGVLVRREVMRRVGGSEEAFRAGYTDQVLYAKIVLEAPVFVSGECWYRYRQHPSSCGAVMFKTGQHHSARLAFLNWLQEYMSGQGVKDGELWRGLQEQLWPYRHPIAHRLKCMAADTLPAPVLRWLRDQKRRYGRRPPVGWVHFGSLRRLKPISGVFGFDRGLCIDRYYIERFLSTYSSDIKGRVLEVEDDTYTLRFGGDRVVQSDVLHVEEGNPKATIVADLTFADHIPSDTFDCLICTQTLQFIYDLRVTIRTLYRILKPGGVLLVSFPGISQISRDDMDRWGEYWRFTTLSARRLFEEIFSPDYVTVEAYGNVLAAIAYLHGLAAEELRQNELDHRDPDYEVLITVRAVKAE